LDQKRGVGALKVELNELALIAREHTTEILDLNEALETGDVVTERKITVGRVVVACDVATERKVTIGRVAAAGTVVIERASAVRIQRQSSIPVW
jgi:hypothetical protein